MSTTPMEMLEIRVNRVSPMPLRAAFSTMEVVLNSRKNMMMRKKLMDMPTVSGCRLQMDMMGPASMPASMPRTRERITVSQRMVWK